MTGPESLADAWRECAPRVLSALVRRCGDLDTAEDAASEALVAAARQWPSEGVPADPGAWLIRVGSRRLVDQWRADRARADREELSARSDVPPIVSDHDDSLALLFLCCHPSLPRAGQVALTLRSVAGLSTPQIAQAFLVPEKTMAQRISRAKARLRQAGARFTLPAPADLPERTAAVAQVLYLIFTEGHTDASLATEAIRLTRRLHGLLPAADEITGLLALMLLTEARRSARLSPGGVLVPLAVQDRSTWDSSLIAEGVSLVTSVLPTGAVGPYQLQAAIAAVHSEAPTAADTDWAQIDILYQMLENLAAGPMVTLNRAVAVGHATGADAALALLAPLLADPTLRHHHRLHAVHGHLLDLAGRVDEARHAYATAAGLATSIPEQRYLNTLSSTG